MSFSSEVKEELARQLSPARHCRIAELSAIMHLCGQYGATKDGALTIGFQTENESVVRKGFTLLKKTYNIESDVALTGEEKKNLIDKFGDLKAPIDPVLIKSSCCKRAYLRGAFLCCGSISDPEKGYHLEFVCDSEEKAEQIKTVIGESDIDAKIVLRKKYYVVFLPCCLCT